MTTKTTTTTTTTTARAAKAEAQRETIAAYKLASGCAMCGNAWQATMANSLRKAGKAITTRTLALGLDLDHVDTSAKRANVADMVGRYSDDAIRAELAKCRTLCKSCHAVHTFLVQR